MAALSDPVSTIVSWLKAYVVPTGARLHSSDEDTLDGLAGSGAKVDGDWFWRMTSIESGYPDLNANRLTFGLMLSGVWSTAGDTRQVGRIVGVAASVVRKIEIQPAPEGVDLVEIPENIVWSDQFGLTVVPIPIRVKCQLEEI